MVVIKRKIPFETNGPQLKQITIRGKHRHRDAVSKVISHTSLIQNGQHKKKKEEGHKERQSDLITLITKIRGTHTDSKVIS
jgi:hypothetical protein